jgi:hypothetical protein
MRAKMVLRIHSSAAALIGVLAFGPTARACLCGVPPPPAPGQPLREPTVRDVAQGHVDNAGVILEGLVEHQNVEPGFLVPEGVLSLTPQGAHRVVTVRILRGYRGAPRETLTVLTGMGNGDCGVEFETGQQYLIFANLLTGGEIFTNICTGTQLLSRSGPAVRLLRSEPPAPDDLLTTREYYDKMFPQWTGKVCGRVSNSVDGSPVRGANVILWQPSEGPFPPKEASDPNLSGTDGSFCISADPGEYLLTAETEDFDAGARLMGFYPGVSKRSEAAKITVKSGSTISGVVFGVRKEPFYVVNFRVATADGSPLPSTNLRVRIDSPDSDPLSYHEDQGVEDNGTCELGGIPAGHYVVATFFEPGNDPEKAATEASKWVPSKVEVNITGNQEVSLTLAPAPVK